MYSLPQLKIKNVLKREAGFLSGTCLHSQFHQYLCHTSESTVKVILWHSTDSFIWEQAFTEPFIKDQEQS